MSCANKLSFCGSGTFLVESVQTADAGDTIFVFMRFTQCHSILENIFALIILVLTSSPNCQPVPCDQSCHMQTLARSFIKLQVMHYIMNDSHNNLSRLDIIETVSAAEYPRLIRSKWNSEYV